MPHSLDWATWGKVIVRATREQRRWTREELAKRSGLGAATIRNVESGRHVPTRDTVATLCAALSLTVPWDAPTLRISLEGLSEEATKGVLLTALAEFSRRREDVGEFVKQAHPTAPWDEVPRHLATVQMEVEIAQALCERITLESYEIKD